MERSEIPRAISDISFGAPRTDEIRLYISRDNEAPACEMPAILAMMDNGSILKLRTNNNNVKTERSNYFAFSF